MVDGPVGQLLPGGLAILVITPPTLLGLGLGLGKVRRRWGRSRGWRRALTIGSLTWRITDGKTCRGSVAK